MAVPDRGAPRGPRIPARRRPARPSHAARCRPHLHVAPVRRQSLEPDGTILPTALCVWPSERRKCQSPGKPDLGNFQGSYAPRYMSAGGELHPVFLRGKKRFSRRRSDWAFPAPRSPRSRLAPGLSAAVPAGAPLGAASLLLPDRVSAFRLRFPPPVP